MITYGLVRTIGPYAHPGPQQYKKPDIVERPYWAQTKRLPPNDYERRLVTDLSGWQNQSNQELQRERNIREIAVNLFSQPFGAISQPVGGQVLGAAPAGPPPNIPPPLISPTESSGESMNASPIAPDIGVTNSYTDQLIQERNEAIQEKEATMQEYYELKNQYEAEQQRANDALSKLQMQQYMKNMYENMANTYKSKLGDMRDAFQMGIEKYNHLATSHNNVVDAYNDLKKKNMELADQYNELYDAGEWEYEQKQHFQAIAERMFQDLENLRRNHGVTQSAYDAATNEINTLREELNQVNRSRLSSQFLIELLTRRRDVLESQYSELEREYVNTGEYVLQLEEERRHLWARAQQMGSRRRSSLLSQAMDTAGLTSSSPSVKSEKMSPSVKSEKKSPSVKSEKKSPVRTIKIDKYPEVPKEKAPVYMTSDVTSSGAGDDVVKYQRTGEGRKKLRRKRVPEPIDTSPERKPSSNSAAIRQAVVGRRGAMIGSASTGSS